MLLAQEVKVPLSNKNTYIYVSSEKTSAILKIY